VVIGKAYCIHEIFVNPKTRRLAEDKIFAELRRFELAREQTAADLHALYQKVATQVGAEQATIFRAHESILRDPAFTAKVRARIVDHREAAPVALDNVLGSYTALFARMEDEYLRDRLVDVRPPARSGGRWTGPAAKPAPSRSGRSPARQRTAP
jgi:phosphotransferase system enzyme I (PtsI)